MKAKDLRERSPEDLKELDKSLAKDVFTARFKNFTNRLDDTSTINKTKRDLARVKTLLRQAELTSGASASTAAAAVPARAEAKAAAAPKTKKTAATTASKSEAK